MVQIGCTSVLPAFPPELPYTLHYFGGGVSYGNYCPSSITSSVITRNHSNNDGGGMYSYQSTGNVANSLFADNTAVNRGGGIFNYESTQTITNTTITGNSANYSGGGIYCYSQTSQPVVNNSIIWGNTALLFGNQISLDAASMTLNYSCYSNMPGDIYLSSATFNVTHNNITLDPQFVNPAYEDYRIYGYSPCMNTGNNAYNALTTDIRGNDRIQNTTIDMGAYEWTSGFDPGAHPHIVDLPAGWSGFSSFLDPTDPSIENLLVPIINELIIVKNFTQVYWPDRSINTIGNFDYQKGYYIKTEGPVSLQIQGSIPANKTVNLLPGWNLLPVL